MGVFIAINMDDFHANQKDGRTIVEIKFISASSTELARIHMQTWHPDITWAIIPKYEVDKNTVVKSGDEKICFRVKRSDFTYWMDRDPTEDEFDEFCDMVKKGIDGQLDWDLLYQCARDDMSERVD